MKDAYELLYQKESDVIRLRREIESLAIVAPLLADEPLAESELSSDLETKKAVEKAVPSDAYFKATGTGDPSPRIARRPGLWRSLMGKGK